MDSDQTAHEETSDQGSSLLAQNFLSLCLGSAQYVLLTLKFQNIFQHLFLKISLKVSSPEKEILLLYLFIDLHILNYRNNFE